MIWKEFVQEESQKEYFSKITSFIKQDSLISTIYPQRSNWFTAYLSCPLDQIKVVILGQDPYHGPNQAHGLSFSVLPGCPIPPSLKNIFKEIRADIGSQASFSNGYLLPWARQGVFLLNSVLTVRQGQPGSHKDIGWHTFTDNTIKLINDIDSPIVFMLWGAFAKGKKSLITNPKHLVLEAAHPSPFSAHDGFFGCKHFSKVNDFLITNGHTPISWDIE
jgi:uracil-DNA glycosylase